MPQDYTAGMDMTRLLEDIASNCNSESEVREGYSGRSMYGKTCWGIVTDDYVSCIEQAALLGLTGAVTDSMGRSTIVYWPRPSFTDECETEYSCEVEEDEIE